MITRIQNSTHLKHLAVLLASSILLMAFKINGKGEVILNAGTNIALETTNMIQSDLVSIGQIIDFRVKYDVKIEGKTVIAAGSLARGQVMRAQKPRGIGRPGSVDIQIKTVTAVDGQEVFLSGGNVYQEGEDRQTESVILGIFVCILFLAMKGKNAQVPAGYQISSSVATTMTIQV
ncbi:MAG: hypothetical protein IPP69_15370 [Flavobacteriales bacterium]|nr:hypothetical protein [Flavobacteriales bacterium]